MGSSRPPQLGQTWSSSSSSNALIDKGYEISAPPGSAVRLAREGTVVEPFRRASDYLFGKVPPDEWTAWLASLGLVGASPTPPSAA
jgi:hypothetical protein